MALKPLTMSSQLKSAKFFIANDNIRIAAANFISIVPKAPILKLSINPVILPLNVVDENALPITVIAPTKSIIAPVTAPNDLDNEAPSIDDNTKIDAAKMPTAIAISFIAPALIANVIACNEYCNSVIEAFILFIINKGCFVEFVNIVPRFLILAIKSVSKTAFNNESSAFNGFKLPITFIIDSPSFSIAGASGANIVFIAPHTELSTFLAIVAAVAKPDIPSFNLVIPLKSI